MSLKSFLKSQRLKLKYWYHQSLLKHHDFSIISNNCWGTRTYQKYGLEYLSPFQSALIFAPDYINLITNFSLEKLEILSFIEPHNSKYIDELKRQDLYDTSYPIALLKDATEVHFLHYKTPEDAYDKWTRRVKRINLKKLIFKFSDGDLATDLLIQKFDQLPYPNKICFTSKPYSHLKNVVFMERFKNQDRVTLEWKYDYKYMNLHKFINHMTTK